MKFTDKVKKFIRKNETENLNVDISELFEKKEYDTIIKLTSKDLSSMDSQYWYLKALVGKGDIDSAFKKGEKF